MRLLASHSLWRGQAQPDTFEWVMSDGQVLAVLRQLIQACEEDGLRFRACAQFVERLELCWVFARRAVDYAQAAQDLLAQTRRLSDEAPPAAGTAEPSGWVAMRSAFRSYNELSLLKQCELSERLAIKRYQRALQQPLPESARALVARQSQALLRSHEQIAQRYRLAAMDTARSACVLQP